MSKIINELARIEISDQILRNLDVDGLFREFVKLFSRLDDLKKFRSDFENKNWFMKFWDNDQLRDAQLDSAEVQAKFSKLIGQLMVISIMQSKKLAEQQLQLHDQQGKLKVQADGIAEHASELQQQHHALAEQAIKLETLLHEYFALRGLTESGTQKLIEVAREVKATKDGLLREFDVRTKDVEALCGDVASRIGSLSAQVDDQIRLSAEQTRFAIVALRDETRVALATSESALRSEQDAAQIERAARMTEVATDLSRVKEDLGICSQSQQALQQEIGQLQLEVGGRINRLGHLATALSLAVIGLLGAMAHNLRWF